MKKTLQAIALLIFNFGLAQNPTLQWANQVGTTGNEQLNLTAVDQSGFVITAGSYTNSGQMVITKYDAAGTVVWTKLFSGSYPIKPYDLKTDALDNIIIVGEFSSLVDFDPSPTTTYNLGVQNYSQSPLFYFILKLDASGNFVFAKQTGGSPRSVNLDSNQNIYIVGTFSNTQDFNPSPTITTNFTSFDGYSIFITKLDSSANYIWNKVIGKTTVSTSGFGNCGATVVLNDSNNNVLVSGYFSDDVDFDPGTGVTSYNSGGALHTMNPFILKLDAAGVFVWARYFHSNENSQSEDMELDSSGNIYTTGTIQGFMDFDSSAGTLYLSHTYRIVPYVSKMSSSGDIIWAKQLFTTDYGVTTKGLKIEPSGNIFVSGTFKNTLNYTTTAGFSGTATTSGFTIGNVYLTSLNSAGSLTSFSHFGGTGITQLNKMIYNNNSILLSGNFNSVADFDFTTATNNLTPVGNSDNFIAKYNITNVLSSTKFNELNGTLFPNPATNNLNLQLPTLIQNGTLKIISLTGQTVFEKQNINGSDFNFDVSSLNSGLYLIQVADEQNKFSSKFIKQ